MLKLAIPIETDRTGATVVETNNGCVLRVTDWPQDCEFQLVAFRPRSRKGTLVRTDQLAEDIQKALAAMDTTGVTFREEPDWYRRLVQYASSV
jgi:hypothetical protein